MDTAINKIKPVKLEFLVETDDAKTLLDIYQLLTEWNNPHGSIDIRFKELSETVRFLGDILSDYGQ